MKIRFLCGHELDLNERATTAPVCHCGETAVVRVQARAPRFVGSCTGPYAQYQSLEAVPVNLATAGPLPLKE